jgi:hypothetical protein
VLSCQREALLPLPVHIPLETLDILEVCLVKKYEANFDAILTAWKKYLKNKFQPLKARSYFNAYP